VAIRAVFSHIRENRLHMALRALHFFVHAAQRIIRLIVIEFGHCPYRPPPRRGVAVFARNGQRPVRTPSGLPLPHGERSRPSQDGEKRQPAHEMRRL
jgi:hypothetical protein